MAGGFRLSLDFYGDEQVNRTIARVQDNVTDVSPAWEEMARDFMGVEAQQFGSGGMFSGGWSPLSPRYAAWKAKNYPGQPIMVLTGALRDQLTKRPFGIEQIGPLDMVIGSDLDYGGYHQRGDDPMPQRRVVELDDAHRRSWVKIMQRYLFGNANGMGS